MGAFFCLIGIAKSPPSALLEALATLESPKGDFVELYENPSGHFLVMPGQIMHDAKGIVRQLSSQLQVSCCLFSFSDDVVWGYDLFHGGRLLDSYCSRPNFFAQVSEDEILRLKGSPDVICAHWPCVSAENISGYLTNKELLSKDADSRAYEGDKSYEWDAWQLCDFMRKLGLEHPVDENGALIREPLKTLNIATEAGLAEKANFDEMLARIRSKRENASPLKTMRSEDA